MDCILILLSRIYYSSVRFSQFFSTVFIARQAQHTTRNIDIVFLSVCLSVRLSVRCVPVFHGKAVASIFVRGNSPSLTLPSPSHRSPHLPSPALPFPPPSRGPLPHYQLEGLGERCKRIFGHFCGSETYLMAEISPLCYAQQMTKFTQIGAYLLKIIC